MESDVARERVYEIFAAPEPSVATKVDDVLELGADFLGLDFGFLTRIDAGTQEIVQATGDHDLLQPGETCPLEEAYCRRTIELDSVLAVQDAADSGAVSDVAFETFDLGAYIGAKVVVGDETYGTVCFAAEDERHTAFSEAEAYFVELVARRVGQALERRRYEQDLAARESQLSERRELARAVVEASFDLVFQIGVDGVFTYVSTPVQDLLGYPPEHYVGEPFTKMLPDEETATLGARRFEEVLQGETIEEFYFPLADASDERVFVDVRVTPIYDATVTPEDRTPDDVVGGLGMARDATERYRRDRLIRVLNRVLRHNLRNEMNVVQGYADLLRDEVPPDARRYVHRILDTSTRLLELGNTARTLEEYIQQPPTRDAIDLVPMAERVAADVRDRYPSATITVDAPATAVAETAPRVETAMLELLENAAKHSGNTPTIDLSITREANRVRVQITDDGPGLPDQERAVLAAGDETPLSHGSGLGLWLVHWIVESLDGTLQVADTATGTRIEIAFPTPDATEDDETATDAAAHGETTPDST